jgi:hypothetical protein
MQHHTRNPLQNADIYDISVSKCNTCHWPRICALGQINEFGERQSQHEFHYISRWLNEVRKGVRCESLCSDREDVVQKLVSRKFWSSVTNQATWLYFPRSCWRTRSVGNSLSSILSIWYVESLSTVISQEVGSDKKWEEWSASTTKSIPLNDLHD